ncbi:MAG: hypothetical protein MJ252_14555 [archaeon]|nr:hypothetical protein [archaeon]
MDLYEESMPETSGKDYTIYFNSEESSDFDILSKIMKKGEIFQKQALIMNLKKYLNNDGLFLSLISGIIHNLEEWDRETQSLFSKYLFKIVTAISPKSSIYQKLMNIIIKHILFAVCNFHDTVTTDYIFYFDKIVNFIDIQGENEEEDRISNLGFKKKRNKKRYVEIDEDIYEFVISLGKFGQTVQNRKMCAFFCSSLIRINKANKALIKYILESSSSEEDDIEPNKEIKNKTQNSEGGINKLFERFLVLSGDSENEIKRQIAHEMRYMIRIFYSESEPNSDLITNLISLLKSDWDHHTQIETIISILDNLYILLNSKDMLDILFELLQKIITNLYFEKDLVCKIFISLNTNIVKATKICFNNRNLKAVYEKYFQINTINEFFNVFEKNEGAIVFREALLHSYANMNHIIKYSKLNYSLISVEQSEQIMDKIYSEISDSNTLKTEQEYTVKFYEELSEFISFIPKNKLPQVEEKRKLSNEKAQNPPKANQVDNFNVFGKENFSYFYGSKKFLFLLKQISDDKHLNHLVSPILNLMDFITSDSLSYNEKLFAKYRNKSSKGDIKILKPNEKVIKAIKEFIPYIYRNAVLNKHKEEYYDIIYSKIEALLNRKIGYQIKSYLMEILANITKYSIKRQTYLNYVDKNFLYSNSFYERRLYIIFLKECFEVFSIKYLVDYKIWDNILILLSDKVSMISCSMIKIYNKYIYLLNHRYKEMNEEILKKIYNLKNREQNESQGDSQNLNDKEKIKLIKDLLNFTGKPIERKLLNAQIEFDKEKEKEDDDVRQVEEDSMDQKELLGPKPNNSSAVNKSFIQRKPSFVSGAKFNLPYAKSGAKSLPPVTAKTYSKKKTSNLFESCPVKFGKQYGLEPIDFNTSPSLLKRNVFNGIKNLNTLCKGKNKQPEKIKDSDNINHNLFAKQNTKTKNNPMNVSNKGSPPKSSSGTNFNYIRNKTALKVVCKNQPSTFKSSYDVNNKDS